MYLPAYPLSRNFVGRDDSRKKLTEWWRSAKQPVCTIVELGGMGKSSLAWVWLHYDLRRLEPDGSAAVTSAEKPEAVLWYSFYETNSSVTAFLRTVGEYLEASTSKSALTLEAIVSAMQKRRGLIVLDGFERQLLGYSSFDQPHREESEDSIRLCVDHRLAKFLTLAASVPGNGTKILITSRLLPKEFDGLAGVNQIELSGLSEEEATDFLEKEAPGTDKSDLKIIAKKFSGHPLALRLAAGLLNDPNAKRSDLLDADSIVGSLVQSKNHILQAAFDALESSEKSFLMTLSAFRGATSFDATLAVLAIETTEFWHQVSKLVDRGFLLTNRNGRQFDLHPIVRLYAYSRLLDKSGTANRIGDFFGSIVRSASVTTLEQAEPIFEICYQYARAGRYDEAYGVFADRLWMDIGVKLGEQTVLQQLVELFFPKGLAAPSPVSNELQPRLLSQTASLLISADRNSDLIALLSDRVNDQSSIELIEAAQHLGRALCGVGRFSEGIGRLKGLLDLTRDLHRKGHIHHHLSIEFDKLYMRKQAMRHFRLMKSRYQLSLMMDDRHSFEVTALEFSLTKSLLKEKRLLERLDGLARKLDWKSAKNIVAWKRAGFLVRRLEKARKRFWLFKQLAFGLSPAPDDAIVAEQLLDDQLNEERQSGNLSGEASSLRMAARLKLSQEELIGARAAASEAVQLSRRVDDIFVRLYSIELLARIERRIGNEDGYASLQREAFDAIPDDPMAASLRDQLFRS